VWSRIDEAQHTDFIVQLSHGVYPLVDQTTLAPETLELMKKTGVYRGLPKGTYPIPDLNDIGPPPPGMSAAANAAWMNRHLWQLSFETAQTPGYYFLMVPVWLAADKLGGPLTAVYVLRIVNALLIASLAPMAVYVASRLWPARNDVMGLAALFAILLPSLALNGTRVSNDALAAVLGGLAVVLAIRWVGGPWPWRRVVLLGLTLGAALLVKLIVIGLLPAFFFAMLWPRPSWSQVGRGPVLVTVAVACLIPWFMINLHLYGVPLPGQHADRLTDALPMSPALTWALLDVGVFNLTYWTGEPFGSLPFAAQFTIFGLLLALMAVAGIVWLVRTRSKQVASGPLWVAIVATMGLVGLALVLPATAGFVYAAPGRYAWAALPAAAALCGLGIATVLRNTVARRTLGTLYGVAAAGLLLLYAGVPVGEAAGPGAPPAGAAERQVSAQGEMAGVVLSIDQIAMDPSAHALWVAVTATNSGPTEAEWTPAPVASAGSAIAYGDYLRSTHLPGDLDPGQTVAGWLFIPIDPAKLHAGDSLRLRFPAVAVDRYRTVADIEVVVQL
jgi:hypothetical protein